jgi:hypothetical protein
MNSAAALHPSTPCDQALAIWFDQHKAYIRGGTVRTYRQYITTLANFFHAKPLAEIGQRYEITKLGVARRAAQHA